MSGVQEQRQKGVGSGNINDTNVQIVQQQVLNFILDVKNGEFDEEKCKSKYNILYKTSRSLFDFILKDIPKQINNGTFDENAFSTRLNNMLLLVTKIQEGKTDLYKASTNVGGELASEYLKDFM